MKLESIKPGENLSGLVNTGSGVPAIPSITDLILAAVDIQGIGDPY